MQDESGQMHSINSSQFTRLLEEMNGNAPVVQIGDTFRVRDCRFEVTQITPDGIVAKGLSRADFLNKHFKR